MPVPICHSIANLPRATHTASYQGIFDPKCAENSLPSMKKPPYILTILPTVGPLDYSRPGYSRNPSVVRCVVCECDTLMKRIQTPMAQGRSSKIISMITWIRTCRLSMKNSLPNTLVPFLSTPRATCINLADFWRRLVLIGCRAVPKRARV